MKAAAALGALLVLSAIGSCYEPELKDCTVRCGPGDSCPNGQRCDHGFCAARDRTCEAPSSPGGSNGEGGTTGGTQPGSGGGGDAGPEIPVSTDLLLWLDANQGLSGDPGIGKWEDSSGNGYDATQEESAKQPQRTMVGELPAVSFDGLADFLKLPSGFSDFSRGLTVFTVARLETLVDCTELFHLSNGAEEDDINLLYNRDGAVSFEVFEGVMDWEGDVPFSETVLLSVHLSPAAGGTLYLNGESVFLEPGLSVPELPDSGVRSQNYVGDGLYNNCEYFAGLLFEFALFSRALTSEELDLMHAHLKEKWQCCE